MSKKDEMANGTPRFCVSHTPFNGANFFGVGTGHSRSSGENRFESLFGTNSKLLRGVFGPRSTPNDYLNTVLNDVVSLRQSCRNKQPSH